MDGKIVPIKRPRCRSRFTRLLILASLAFCSTPAVAQTSVTTPETPVADPPNVTAETIEAIKKQLREYFDGKRTMFDLPVSPKGTDFNRKVWTAVARIPHGRVVTYGDIARGIGHPKAVRAVGAANGRNPVPIVIPCHRVIGTGGRLTGYGGGLDLKAKLLRLEGLDLSSQQATSGTRVVAPLAQIPSARL